MRQRRWLGCCGRQSRPSSCRRIPARRRASAGASIPACSYRFRDRRRDRPRRSCRSIPVTSTVCSSSTTPLLVDDDEVGRAIALAGETARPPGWIERSAISGLPTTTVEARSGSLQEPRLVEHARRWCLPAREAARPPTRRSRLAAGHCRQPAHQAELGLASRDTTPSSILSETLRGTQQPKRLHSPVPLDCKLVKEVQISRQGSPRRDVPLRLVANPSGVGCRVICVNGCTSWAPKRRREFAIGDPVVIGQLAGRHVERAEHQVEHRERLRQSSSRRRDPPRCGASGGRPARRSRI